MEKTCRSSSGGLSVGVVSYDAESMIIRVDRAPALYNTDEAGISNFQLVAMVMAFAVEDKDGHHLI